MATDSFSPSLTLTNKTLMPKIAPEIVEQLNSFQNQIWQTASMTVSEAVNNAVEFNTPLTLTSNPSELFGEMASPKLVLQFSFSDQPENSQIILINQDTLLGLVSEVTNLTATAVDDVVIQELRPMVEAMVQGICIACGNIRNDAVVASGLMVRFQIFSFPPNLQRADDLLRVNLAINVGETQGSMTWLMDEDAARFLINQEDEDDSTLGGLAAGAAAPQISGEAHFDESGMEILMDIPLEISVELGRKRMVVRDIVELISGSIIEIDKAAGEPVDVLVNGKLVARGEVVVIEDNFGVRITEILSPQERLQRLNDAA